MFSMGSGSFMQYAKITCKLWNVDIWGMPKKLIAYSILVHFLMNEGGASLFFAGWCIPNSYPLVGILFFT